jgi:crotonobetainyl-CoA:carnitine CoA-transferase CaiB-like acyl-CoA transferase
MTGPVGSDLLRRVWALLELPGAAPRPEVQGRTGLAGPLPVGDLVVGAVAAQLGAAAVLRGAPPPERLDAAHVGLAVRSERYVREGGRPVGPGFAPLSRFWRTGDGWLRLHANYPHHRAAALRVLGEDYRPDLDRVAAAVAGWPALALETAVVEAGGAAAVVRRPDEWAAGEPGRAVADLPLLTLRRTTDGPVRTAQAGGPRVLDLTRVIAGPVATRTLASHGADVLRVDSPHRPDDRGGLLDTGAGKRHVLLDLADPRDRRTVEDLLATADAVVLGYRPGALDRFGLAPVALRERHPHLVVTSLSAWSTAGPWRARRGFDSLVQAATGIAAVCGADGVPGALPAQALDHATGHLAAAAVLAGLARRGTEGGGWHGELSLAQTAAWLLGAPRRVADGDEDVDPAPYLVDLPSAGGIVTLVRPPGSPVWPMAARLPGEAAAEWLPRA